MPMSSSLYTILSLTPVLCWATQTNSGLRGVAMGEGLHRPGVVALPLHLPLQNWVCGTRVDNDDQRVKRERSPSRQGQKPVLPCV